MKDFAKILEEALMERNEALKKQKELAEEIIEEALKRFKNVDVKEVVIKCVEESTIVVIDMPSGLENKYSNLCFCQDVYDIISEILFSNDDKFKNVLENGLGMRQEKGRITLQLE